MAVPNSNFFFQLRLDLEEDFRFGMCREVWCLIRRDLHGGAVFDEPVLFTAQDLFWYRRFFDESVDAWRFENRGSTPRHKFENVTIAPSSGCDIAQ